MAQLTYTAVNPGVGGNLILVEMVAAGSGPAATVVVADLGLNQFRLDVTVNTAGGFTCAQAAALLMAEPAVTALVTVTGDANPVADLVLGKQRLEDGTTGQGQP